jgi:hypothetical protein
MNPQGVGYSGATMMNHTATCDCCEMEFTFRAPVDRGSDRTRCDQCADHRLGGMLSEQLLALREHQQRYPPAVATARRIARDAKAEEARAQEELKEGRLKVAEALRSRNRHQAIHVAVMAEHVATETGKCLCGQRFPCPTVDAERGARDRVGDPEEWM